MNNNIVWKKFKLSELFNIDKSKVLPGALKDHITYNTPQTNTTPNVTASMYNNGISNYIENNPKVESLKQKNEITIATNGAGLGTCFYHDYEFVMSSGSIAILQAYNNKLKSIVNTNKKLGGFIAKIITKIIAKNDCYDWGYKINNERFEREVILLPCIECSKEESIWEEKYTLAVEYIESLMERAKERREANTIKKYEAERKKYEAERKKYEAEYLTEKPNVVWKCHNLDKLFKTNKNHRLSKATKEYTTASEYTNGYIANITASKFNEGIANYILIDSEINNKQQNNKITIATNGAVGFCFYHNYPFISTSDTKIIQGKNELFNELLNNSVYVGKYIAKLLTKLFTGGIFHWMYKVNDDNFNRELILLPYLECSKENSIIEEEGKYYTLAVNYISYIYLSGMIKNCQRLIDNYTYKY